MPDKFLPIAISIVGLFFLASGLQAPGVNAFRQSCSGPAVCWHPEWAAVGIAVLAVAFVTWRRRRP